ncbi:hypothetical protein E1I69_13320 [Bacillus timonensis]|uniref:Uncharacterized protein n=1 Tax=Bacillus timonensis TaxID=1033734 RepID=A0A4S3PQD3_9BACI|nr:hypothetical protein [Bacillus timonensis]THE11861.1 hypothetical protein E1I69_13320 [Bacillus timonensis]
MNISSTMTIISNEEALEIVKKNRLGIVDKILSFFKRDKKLQETIIDSDCVYYPYWIIHFNVDFPKKTQSMFMVVDGFKGLASFGQGFPIVQNVEVSESKIVRCLVNVDEAKEKASNQLTNNLIFKHKKLPSFKIVQVDKLFKPQMIFCMSNGRKTFYKAIDTESGQRNYSLDINYQKLLFEQDKICLIQKKLEFN